MPHRRPPTHLPPSHVPPLSPLCLSSPPITQVHGSCFMAMHLDPKPGLVQRLGLSIVATIQSRIQGQGGFLIFRRGNLRYEYR